ncbi:DUF748 domain-containing protein [Bdellovibrio sp. HCB2-146]|uniref:DUF748 domain-containing protein n=1 Tax=Bdellovibrio sp. HCB2-146 TaxID=3394362 RepID=UPI0039BCEC5B
MKRLVEYPRHILMTILIFILFLILLRIFLPVGAKYGINWYLDNKLKNYQGHIEDFDLALYRGAYQVEGLKIWKRTSSAKNPFLSVKQIDLSLAWRALFSGKLLGDLSIDEMKLVMLDSDKKDKKEFGEGEDWKTMAGKIVPIELESLQIRNSEVHMMNRDFKVPIDVVLDKVMLEASNIKNTNDSKELLPSTVSATARFQKSAALKAKARMNLISKIPAFEAKAQLEKLDITKLNQFFKAYGPFTFTSGRFSVYTEVSTKNNRVVGYVKPFFENLDVISENENFGSPKRFFNEVGLAMGNLLIRNRKEKTVATKIEFVGAAMSPDVDKWGAFWSSLRNGFVEALKRSLENTISIKDVPDTKK